MLYGFQEIIMISQQMICLLVNHHILVMEHKNWFAERFEKNIYIIIIKIIYISIRILKKY